MGLAHLKTDTFLANAALFQCAILAYNTLQWMALVSGEASLLQWEIAPLRRELIQVAGKLLTGGRQLHLRIPLAHSIRRPGKRGGPWQTNPLNAHAWQPVSNRTRSLPATRWVG